MAAPIYVQNRRIFHRRGGRTQTVNICTPENRQGIYESVFRLDARTPITANRIAANGSIEALTGWLMASGAQPEGPRFSEFEPEMNGSEDHKGSESVGNAYKQTGRPGPVSSPGATVHSSETVFLVHGHDGAAKHEVARFVERMTGKSPVILDEQANRGRTLLEKFEEIAGAANYAIVLATPDDMGRPKSLDFDKGSPRARQNVVFELGFFFGRLGRGRVAVLNAGVEKPSDIDGIAYFSYPAGNWKIELAKEMHAAGITVDMHRLLD
ncbi:TIR domain-containing protein [Actinoplanes sp. CA-015351]|uniref:TIR domain-containing protein n=1 Tax=Actinoplanes sp. CA-015351 TaxID=3239897 RepID=UPI003D9867BB